MYLEKIQLPKILCSSNLPFPVSKILFLSTSVIVITSYLHFSHLSKSLSKSIFPFLKNWIVGQCNSRISIGSAIIVYELYKYRNSGKCVRMF